MRKAVLANNDALSRYAVEETGLGRYEDKLNKNALVANKTPGCEILRAQADRESSILRAQGEGQAIQTVFQAIHDGQPDQSLLAYQYLQMMPKIAEGSANKVWVIPSEITKAMEGLGSSIHEIAGIPKDATPRTRVDMGPGLEAPDQEAAASLRRAHDEVAAAHGLGLTVPVEVEGVRLIADLGIQAVNLGLPGAGPRAVECTATIV